jgi:hypothetical protein
VKACALNSADVSEHPSFNRLKPLDLTQRSLVIGIILANTLFSSGADTISSHALSTSSVTPPISAPAQSSSNFEAQDSTPALNTQARAFLDRLIHAKPSGGKPSVGFPGSPSSIMLSQSAGAR